MPKLALQAPKLGKPSTVTPITPLRLWACAGVLSVGSWGLLIVGTHGLVALLLATSGLKRN
jgi:hypothetical protein